MLALLNKLTRAPSRFKPLARRASFRFHPGRFSVSEGETSAYPWSFGRPKAHRVQFQHASEGEWGSAGDRGRRMDQLVMFELA